MAFTGSLECQLRQYSQADVWSSRRGDCKARFPFKRKRLRFLRFSFTQRTQRKRLRLNGNRALVDYSRAPCFFVGDTGRNKIRS